jgi:hypothetical protein
VPLVAGTNHLTVQASDAARRSGRCPAISALTLTEMVETVPAGNDTPRLFAVAQDLQDPFGEATVRALHPDGREAWNSTAGRSASVQRSG